MKRISSFPISSFARPADDEAGRRLAMFDCAPGADPRRPVVQSSDPLVLSMLTLEIEE